MIYIITQHYDNGEEYDDHQYDTCVLGVALTEEKAEKFLKNYVPSPQHYSYPDETIEWIKGKPEKGYYHCPKDAQYIFHRHTCLDYYETIWHTIETMEVIE